MAAAYLDDQLEGLLRQALVDDKAAIDDLLRSSGALGSFSARIELCCALGLLPRQARRELHLIRKIRNDFAHVAKPLAFEEPGISCRCREPSTVRLKHNRRLVTMLTGAVLGVCAVVHGFTAPFNQKHKF